MFKRVLSGTVLTVMAVAALLEGHYLLIICLGLVSLAGQRELYQLTCIPNKNLSKSRMDALAVSGYTLTVLYYIALFIESSPQFLFCLLLAGLLIMMLIYVMVYPKYEPMDLFSGFFAIIYIPVMLSCIYLLRRTDGGQFMVWFVFVGSWVCDTFAYFVGSTLGKHKLAPVLSPKKSVEGAVGGVAGSVIVGLIYGCIVMHLKDGAINGLYLVNYAVLSAVAAVFSQVGDLTASAFKRHYDIKDYGNIIPGHGGILDRFDSVIVIAPLIYIFVSIF